MCKETWRWCNDARRHRLSHAIAYLSCGDLPLHRRRPATVYIMLHSTYTTLHHTQITCIVSCIVPRSHCTVPQLATTPTRCGARRVRGRATSRRRSSSADSSGRTLDTRSRGWRSRTRDWQRRLIGVRRTHGSCKGMRVTVCNGGSHAWQLTLWRRVQLLSPRDAVVTACNGV